MWIYFTDSSLIHWLLNEPFEYNQLFFKKKQEIQPIFLCFLMIKLFFDRARNDYKGKWAAKVFILCNMGVYGGRCVMQGCTPHGFESMSAWRRSTECIILTPTHLLLQKVIVSIWWRRPKKVTISHSECWNQSTRKMILSAFWPNLLKIGGKKVEEVGLMSVQTKVQNFI